MSAVAWAAGSAVARPRGGGDVGGQFQWLAEGAEVGSARLESLSGRRSKKGRRKGHSPPPQRTRTATAALLPRHFVSIPSLPLPRELSRERRAPTLPLPLRPRVPYFLDTFAAPGHAPYVCWGHPFSRGQSTRLGVVAESSELLSWVSAARKEIGCNSGMTESCSEGWNCHQSSAHCRVDSCAKSGESSEQEIRMQDTSISQVFDHHLLPLLQLQLYSPFPSR
nr:uncharacterized protein LOC115864403 [Globicephala melas]